MTFPVIKPSGDASVSVEFENEISPAVNARVTAFARALCAAAIPGVTEYVPTYRAVTVHYRPETIRYAALCERLRAIGEGMEAEQCAPAQVVELPVLYGVEYGPDLGAVAKHAGLCEREVIRLHTAPEYLIYMMGFLPGFTYLGGLDPRLETPRLQTPRTKIPAGSIGIAGLQTGAYPLDSPGGWQLIGRTPVRLYDPEREKPILLEAGQYVKFVSIDRAVYEKIEAQVARGDYCPRVRAREVRA